MMALRDGVLLAYQRRLDELANAPSRGPRSRQASRLREFYRSGIDRLRGEWAGKGKTGEEFRRRSHLYESDLNVFGTGSAFELMCMARSGIGRRRLASYLLDRPERSESLARQDAVRELAPDTTLREQVCLLGSYRFQECDWEPCANWLDVAPVTVARLLPLLLAANSALIGLLLVLWFASSPLLGLAHSPLFLGALGTLLLFQIIFGVALVPRIRPVLERVRRVGPELVILRQGLALLERQNFRCEKLAGLSRRSKDGAQIVRRLDRMISAIYRCDTDPFFYGPSRLLLMSTQLSLAIERWKSRHGKQLKDWLDAWGEFEALNALGGYAHEHPDDVFPELVERPSVFDACALGHPLLMEESCVRNDVSLGAGLSFYLVSGSNMAGKSTLLRAIGLNAVLAAAGAPVRATRARISLFSVCASISLADSLIEGKSKFLAEVERLRETLRLASNGHPVLFLIDEIFSGTNSRDRRIAAESVIRALVEAQAVGAISTHDLALTEIADQPGLRGVNVHMESCDADDPFSFDYRVKPGIALRSNALAIAKLAGVPVEQNLRL